MDKNHGMQAGCCTLEVQALYLCFAVEYREELAVGEQLLICMIVVLRVKKLLAQNLLEVVSEMAEQQVAV